MSDAALRKFAVLGIVLAARFLPSILEHFENGQPSGKLMIALGVLLGGAFVGQALGLIIGSQLHTVLPVGGRLPDRVAGLAERHRRPLGQEKRLVADMVAEWATLHNDPFDLELTGPAGGCYRRGDGGEHATLDAVEFVRIISMRAPGTGVLANPMPL